MYTKKLLLPYAFSCLLLLALIQFIFSTVSKTEAEKSLDSITSLFRNEKSIVDPYNISSEITDLLERGVIECPILQEISSNLTYLDRQDRGNCSPSWFSVTGHRISQNIVAINGKIWTLAVTIPNSNWFSFALWLSRAIVISIISFIFMMQSYSTRLLNEQRNLADAERKFAMEIQLLSKQVAHDIRSPLSALRIFSDKFEGKEEVKKLAVLAIERVQRIAEDLLRNRYGTPADSNFISSQSLKSFFDIKSTELQFPFNANFPENLNISLTMNETIFFRCLSNILNNAFEAVQDLCFSKRIITSKFELQNDFFKVEISDYGQGIPDRVLNLIGKKSISYGKDPRGNSGHGLGLQYVFQETEKVGGKVDIQSKENVGTVVSLTLPIQEQISS